MAEAGIPDQEADTLTGLVAPAGTPQAIVDRLQREIAKMWQDRAEPHKGQPEHDPCERQIAALAAELERVRESLKELRYEVERSPAPGREAMWNIIHAALGPAGEAKDDLPSTDCCPRCGKRCRYRHGREFEHQRRCGECGIVWDPDEREQWEALRDAPPPGEATEARE